MIKIVGLCGSPLKGSTEYVLEQALAAAKAFAPDEIETELISVHGKKISPCVGCGYCKKNKTWCCIKDDMQEIFDKIAHADGLLVASPVYVMTATPQIHAIASRMRPAMHCYPGMLRNKFFAAIAVGGTRNGGQEQAINGILGFYHTQGITVCNGGVCVYAGASLWNPGDGSGTMDDPDGIARAEGIGRKVAKLTNLLAPKNE